MPTIRHHDFGWALRALKLGKSVTRAGWNGENQALVLIPGSTFVVEKGRPLARHIPVGKTQNYLPHIDILTAHGDMVPWLASQGDVLGDDWMLADFAKCWTTSRALTLIEQVAPKKARRPRAPKNITPDGVVKAVRGGARAKTKVAPAMGLSLIPPDEKPSKIAKAIKRVERRAKTNGAAAPVAA